MLFATEEPARTTGLRSLVEGYHRRAGFPGQYEGAACVVSRPDRADEC
jgi:hypothetical protein